MNWTFFHHTPEGWRIHLQPSGATYKFTSYAAAESAFHTLGLDSTTYCINSR